MFWFPSVRNCSYSAKKKKRYRGVKDLPHELG